LEPDKTYLFEVGLIEEVRNELKLRLSRVDSPRMKNKREIFEDKLKKG
jgi:hypothetical protein